MQEAFSKSKERENGGDSNSRRKRIHVRSKDPLKIAKQIEKSLNAAPKHHHHKKGASGPGGHKGVSVTHAIKEKKR